MADNNPKFTPIEWEIMADQQIETTLAIIKIQVANAKLMKAKFEALKAEGFTEQQALEIIKSRPLME
ncbi:MULTISPECIES: hypothetical protein [unclassified Exiguobacterium]|uniref:Phage protein n=1 Tax=Exiguobacterium sp. (strain ATCC BAA-1283 / AT1b) TaxID=360911 RepID=C4L0N6_EXISA|nr:MULTISPECIES: hypothetical protein [unclassified Exiguobacterium]ACQ68954.1 phage protein [Exiguobacterium sp. AT1b]